MIKKGLVAKVGGAIACTGLLAGLTLGYIIPSIKSPYADIAVEYSKKYDKVIADHTQKQAKMAVDVIFDEMFNTIGAYLSETLVRLKTPIESLDSTEKVEFEKINIPLPGTTEEGLDKLMDDMETGRVDGAFMLDFNGDGIPDMFYQIRDRKPLKDSNVIESRVKYGRADGTFSKSEIATQGPLDRWLEIRKQEKQR